MNIMICGVGGQGTLLASRIIGSAVVASGYDVKISEVHGMSQRGGSVVTYVKYGKEVHSPLTDPGTADIVLAFEILEAARALPALKFGGTMLINKQKILPMPVISGKAEYPNNLAEKLAGKADVLTVDAFALASSAGNMKAANVVMIGALAKKSDIPKDVWVQAVRDNVPEKFLDVNLKAFELGYSA